MDISCSIIAFGFVIMANRGRILQCPFQASFDNVKKIVTKCVSLHNCLLKVSKVSPDNYSPPGFTDTEHWEGNLLPGSRCVRKPLSDEFRTREALDTIGQFEQ